MDAAQLSEPASKVHALCPFTSEFAVKSGVFEAALAVLDQVIVCFCLAVCMSLPPFC